MNEQRVPLYLAFLILAIVVGPMLAILGVSMFLDYREGEFERERRAAEEQRAAQFARCLEELAACRAQEGR